MFANKHRPKIHPPKTVVDFISASIAIGALIYGVVLVLQSWSSLPATIPIHFDAVGNADGFGPKGIIWLGPAISIVMIPALLFLRRFPWLINLPIEITEVNAAYQYGLFVRLLSLLACVCSLLFLTLVHDTISIAHGGRSLLGWSFMPIFLVGILSPIIWYIIAVIRHP